jgi:hypothetical protein
VFDDVAVQLSVAQAKDATVVYESEMVSFTKAAKNAVDIVLPIGRISAEYILTYNLYEDDRLVQTQKDNVVIAGIANSVLSQQYFFQTFFTEISIAVALFTFVVCVAMIVLVRQKRHKRAEELLRQKAYIPKKYEVD